MAIPPVTAILIPDTRPATGAIPGSSTTGKTFGLYLKEGNWTGYEEELDTLPTVPDRLTELAFDEKR